MPTHQDGAENRDKAYSELRIFEDKLGKALRDKHDRSYFLELHTYIHTYTHNKMMITRETLNSVKLHTHIHTFIEAPFAGLYRAIFYARCILVDNLQKGNRRIVNPSTL